MSSDTMAAAGGARTLGVRADPVTNFYTSHPYPPPVGSLDRARDEWQDENRHRAEYHLLWPARSYRGDLDILVAGCGTWQAAKYALCRPDARVVGIDVSTTSLDHTQRLKRQYNLSNLELQQLPIEHVERLERRFDLIVCTGVLHHLADPDAGLRALRFMLRPEGALYLMVYAPYGRTGVSMLRDYCRRLGVETSKKEIADLAAVLEVLPQHHPLVGLLRGSRDSGNADALADALLNPRERSYSVPQLFDFLEHNGLTLGRWYWQAPYLPQCGALSATPHAARLAALPEREQYAAVELWRGAMSTHSVIAYRSDTNAGRLKIGFADPEPRASASAEATADKPGREPPPPLKRRRTSRAPSFDDGRWRRYVPIRLPSTMCVQERLPAGAAAVLLNKSHPHHDLILVIGPREKRMFDAIDGRRSIREIVHHARDDDEAWQAATSFFEKLWRYDQVVFDASTPG